MPEPGVEVYLIEMRHFFNMPDFTAGLVISVLFVTTAVSTSALIFSGLGPSYYVAGVTMLLTATAVCALGGTLLSGFWGTVIGPRSGIAPAYATLISSIAAALGTSFERGSSDQFITIVVAMMVATLSTGLILFLIGQFRLGNLVRYIPYPVMGGFFAGIGYIFLSGGIEVAIDRPLFSSLMSREAATSAITLGGPAISFGLIAYALQRYFDHWSVVPLAIAAALAVFHGLLHFIGIDLESAVSIGWLPQIDAPDGSLGITWPIIAIADIAKADWTLIANQSGTILTIALLAAIILLLEVSGIEIVSDTELSPNRELKAAGLTNIANGILGGFAGVHSASESALAINMGAKNRTMGLAYSLGVIVVIMIGIGFVRYIPNFVLGGLLIFLGLNFLVEWLWKNRKDVPVVDYLLIVAILVVIATVGLLPGVAFGIAVATVLFVISYSRIGVVKATISGRNHTSHVVRGVESLNILAEEAGQILILKLQGFIFFGTADSLFDRMRTILETSDVGINYVVIDFSHVSRLDTSAVQMFSKLKRFTKKSGIRIALTGLRPNDEKRLKRANFFTDGSDDHRSKRIERLAFGQLDEGVAWCEDQILHLRLRDSSDEEVSIEHQLQLVLGDPDAARKIAPYFEAVEFEPGDLLFAQGDAGDSLYLLARGEASVVIQSDNEKLDRVIRVFQQGTLLGEMSLYTHEPRTASVRIEHPSHLFKLSIEKFKQLTYDEPVAAGLFHSYVVRLLSERLARANREIQQLS